MWRPARSILHRCGLGICTPSSSLFSQASCYGRLGYLIASLVRSISILAVSPDVYSHPQLQHDSLVTIKHSPLYLPHTEDSHSPRPMNHASSSFSSSHYSHSSLLPPLLSDLRHASRHACNPIHRTHKSDHSLTHSPRQATCKRPRHRRNIPDDTHTTSIHIVVLEESNTQGR